MCKKLNIFRCLWTVSDTAHLLIVGRILVKTIWDSVWPVILSLRDSNLPSDWYRELRNIPLSVVMAFIMHLCVVFIIYKLDALVFLRSQQSIVSCNKYA